MEYPSINDFYLKLKTIYTKSGNFIDYVPIYISDNFNSATKINPNLIIGEKLSDLIIENDNFLGLKELFFNRVPKIKIKHEVYIKNLDRWYLINIFNDKEKNLVVFYCEITEIRENIKLNFCNSAYSFANVPISCYKDALTDLYNRGFFLRRTK